MNSNVRVSFSITPEVISEAGGTALVMNFSVDGEIPEGGITVNLEGDAARIMQQFTAAQTRFNDDLEIFYRFDRGLVADNVTGGILDLFSLEDGDPAEDSSNPEAAGDGFLTNFSFTITEPNASITIPVLDDLIEESDSSFTYTLVDGEGYTVDSDANTGTFTVTDGVEVTEAPVVGVTATPATLIEAEQTEFTLTFNTEGEIPEEGLVVFLEGPVRAISEFDVNASNPRDSEDDITVGGIEVSGGNIVGTNEVAGAVVFRIFEPTATVSVPVFLDLVEEGTENLTFNLRDGEIYDVNPNANVVDVTIEDGVLPAPVVSVDTVAATFDAEDNIIAPYLVDSLEEGTPILSVVIETEGIFPPDGLVVDINSDLGDISELVAEPAFAPFVFGGEFISAIYDDEGTATGFQVKLDNPRAVVNFSGVGLEAEEVQEFSLSVDSGEGYEASDTNSSAPVNVYSTLEQTPTAPEPATVGISVSETTLIEGETATTLSFDVDGEIPEGGLIISVDSGARFSLGEFDLFDAEVTGGTFPISNGGASGFFFKITEPTASITFTAADDNTNPETGEEITEGIEAFTFALQEQPGYTVNADAADVSFTVADDADAAIQVSLSTEPQILIEEEGTVATFTLSLSAAPPEEGVTVSINSENLTDFDALGLEVTGGGLVNIGTDGTVDILVTEQTATVTVPVANDGTNEGLETATFTLVEPDAEAGYQISSDPQANTSSFDIYDTTNEAPVIVESAESDDTIATSIPIAINGDRNTALVRGEIDFDFGDNRDVDQTEDVDMYSVELQIGDRLTLDLDSIPFTNSEGFVLRGGGDLRIFNEAGEELVYNDEGSAPDEVLSSGRDAYIDFTAETAGTYYIGISQTFNEDYDPNVKGTGDGAILPPRFGIGAGEYELNVDINPDAPTFEQFEEFDGETSPDAPTVSFTAIPGTFQGDDIISDQIIESLGVGRGQAALLNFTLNVDGAIPDEGLEVIIKSDTDFTDFLDDLNGTPRTAVGGEIIGAVYNEDGSVAGLRALVTSPNASFPFPVLDREDDDPNAPESIEFSLANSEDYAVSSDTNTSNITFYDTLEQVQIEGNVPQVGVTIDQTELIETEGTEVNISFNVDGEIPEGGLLVYLDSETRSALGDFNVFDAEVTGGAFPAPNGDASGFYFSIQENTANIKLNVFDETTNELIPEEDALEGIESFDFSIVESDGYTIDSDAAGFDFTIADNPDSVVIEEPEEPGEEFPEVPTDNDGREGNNDTIANAVPLGLDPAVDALAVTIDGEISDRFRGEDTVDNTEDVDIYSFDLQAGQTITIDIDANGIGDAGLDSILDSNLRIFDGEGNELALNGQGAAPDEIFQAEGDPYLEFTAPETGTYYAGISALGNDFYDPNVVASGSGWTFGESFGADIYQATFSLGSQFFEPPTEPDLIEVLVTVENLSPSEGTFLTPAWVGFHNGEFDLYNRGEAATPGLERLAEDGNVDLLSEEFANSGFGSVDGAIIGSEGIAGPIDPGETTSATFTIDLNAETSQFFSYASMVIPSNDAFIANGNPTVNNLFDEDGNFIGADFIVAGSDILDAGTEVNDELAENTAFFSQAAPNTGEDENGVVEEHPGFIEGGRILSEDGTTEGAPAAFTNADFNTDGYQVARITVELASDGGNNPDLMPVFGSIDEDAIEVSGSNQLVFAGSINDLVDISTGEGNNRIYAGSGDDTLILGESDRIFAGTGDDAIFTTSGGNNTITGGAGTDSFWIASASIPESANIITDFTEGEDVIGVAGLGIGFSDLTITDTDAGVLVSTDSADLALFTNSSLDEIATEDNFAFA